MIPRFLNLRMPERPSLPPNKIDAFIVVVLLIPLQPDQEWAGAAPLSLG